MCQSHSSTPSTVAIPLWSQHSIGSPRIAARAEGRLVGGPQHCYTQIHPNRPKYTQRDPNTPKYTQRDPLRRNLMAGIWGCTDLGAGTVRPSTVWFGTTARCSPGAPGPMVLGLGAGALAHGIQGGESRLGPWDQPSQHKHSRDHTWTPWCAPMHTPMHSYALPCTRVRPRPLSLHTQAHWYALVHTGMHWCTLVRTGAHWCRPC